MRYGDVAWRLSNKTSILSFDFTAPSADLPGANSADRNAIFAASTIWGARVGSLTTILSTVPRSPTKTVSTTLARPVASGPSG